MAYYHQQPGGRPYGGEYGSEPPRQRPSAPPQSTHYNLSAPKRGFPRSQGAAAASSYHRYDTTYHGHPHHTSPTYGRSSGISPTVREPNRLETAVDSYGQLHNNNDIHPLFPNQRHDMWQNAHDTRDRSRHYSDVQLPPHVHRDSFETSNSSNRWGKAGNSLEHDPSCPVPLMQIGVPIGARHGRMRSGNFESMSVGSGTSAGLWPGMESSESSNIYNTSGPSYNSRHGVEFTFDPRQDERSLNRGSGEELFPQTVQGVQYLLTQGELCDTLDSPERNIDRFLSQCDDYTRRHFGADSQQACGEMRGRQRHRLQQQQQQHPYPEEAGRVRGRGRGRGRGKGRARKAKVGRGGGESERGSSLDRHKVLPSLSSSGHTLHFSKVTNQETRVSTREPEPSSRGQGNEVVSQRKQKKPMPLLAGTKLSQRSASPKPIQHRLGPHIPGSGSIQNRLGPPKNSDSSVHSRLGPEDGPEAKSHTTSHRNMEESSGGSSSRQSVNVLLRLGKEKRADGSIGNSTAIHSRLGPEDKDVEVRSHKDKFGGISRSVSDVRSNQEEHLSSSIGSSTNSVHSRLGPVEDSLNNVRSSDSGRGVMLQSSGLEGTSKSSIHSRLGREEEQRDETRSTTGDREVLSSVQDLRFRSSNEHNLSNSFGSCTSSHTHLGPEDMDIDPPSPYSGLERSDIPDTRTESTGVQSRLGNKEFDFDSRGLLEISGPQSQSGSLRTVSGGQEILEPLSRLPSIEIDLVHRSSPSNLEILTSQPSQKFSDFQHDCQNFDSRPDEESVNGEVPGTSLGGDINTRLGPQELYSHSARSREISESLSTTSKYDSELDVDSEHFSSRPLPRGQEIFNPSHSHRYYTEVGPGSDHHHSCETSLRGPDDCDAAPLTDDFTTSYRSPLNSQNYHPESDVDSGGSLEPKVFHGHVEWDGGSLESSSYTNQLMRSDEFKSDSTHYITTEHQSNTARQESMLSIFPSERTDTSEDDASIIKRNHSLEKCPPTTDLVNSDRKLDYGTREILRSSSAAPSDPRLILSKSKSLPRDRVGSDYSQTRSMSGSEGVDTSDCYVLIDDAEGTTEVDNADGGDSCFGTGVAEDSSDSHCRFQPRHSSASSVGYSFPTSDNLSSSGALPLQSSSLPQSNSVPSHPLPPQSTSVPSHSLLPRSSSIKSVSHFSESSDVHSLSSDGAIERDQSPHTRVTSEISCPSSTGSNKPSTSTRSNPKAKRAKRGKCNRGKKRTNLQETNTVSRIGTVNPTVPRLRKDLQNLVKVTKERMCPITVVSKNSLMYQRGTSALKSRKKQKDSRGSSRRHSASSHRSSHKPLPERRTSIDSSKRYDGEKSTAATATEGIRWAEVVKEIDMKVREQRQCKDFTKPSSDSSRDGPAMPLGGGSDVKIGVAKVVRADREMEEGELTDSECEDLMIDLDTSNTSLPPPLSVCLPPPPLPPPPPPPPPPLIPCHDSITEPNQSALIIEGEVSTPFNSTTEVNKLESSLVTQHQPQNSTITVNAGKIAKEQTASDGGTLNAGKIPHEQQTVSDGGTLNAGKLTEAPSKSTVSTSELHPPKSLSSDEYNNLSKSEVPKETSGMEVALVSQSEGARNEDERVEKPKESKEEEDDTIGDDVETVSLSSGEIVSSSPPSPALVSNINNNVQTTEKNQDSGSSYTCDYRRSSWPARIDCDWRDRSFYPLNPSTPYSESLKYYWRTRSPTKSHQRPSNNRRNNLPSEKRQTTHSKSPPPISYSVRSRRDSFLGRSSRRRYSPDDVQFRRRRKNSYSPERRGYDRRKRRRMTSGGGEDGGGARRARSSRSCDRAESSEEEEDLEVLQLRKEAILSMLSDAPKQPKENTIFDRTQTTKTEKREESGSRCWEIQKEVAEKITLTVENTGEVSEEVRAKERKEEMDEKQPPKKANRSPDAKNMSSVLNDQGRTELNYGYTKKTPPKSKRYSGQSVPSGISSNDASVTAITVSPVPMIELPSERVVVSPEGKPVVPGSSKTIRAKSPTSLKSPVPRSSYLSPPHLKTLSPSPPPPPPPPPARASSSGSSGLKSEMLQRGSSLDSTQISSPPSRSTSVTIIPGSKGTWEVPDFQIQLVESDEEVMNNSDHNTRGTTSGQRPPTIEEIDSVLGAFRRDAEVKAKNKVRTALTPDDNNSSLQRPQLVEDSRQSPETSLSPRVDLDALGMLPLQRQKEYLELKTKLALHAKKQRKEEIALKAKDKGKRPLNAPLSKKAKISAIRSIEVQKVSENRRTPPLLEITVAEPGSIIETVNKKKSGKEKKMEKLPKQHREIEEKNKLEEQRRREEDIRIEEQRKKEMEEMQKKKQKKEEEEKREAERILFEKRRQKRVMKIAELEGKIKSCRSLTEQWTKALTAHTLSLTECESEIEERELKIELLMKQLELAKAGRDKSRTHRNKLRKEVESTREKIDRHSNIIRETQRLLVSERESLIVMETDYSHTESSAMDTATPDIANDQGRCEEDMELVVNSGSENGEKKSAGDVQGEKFTPLAFEAVSDIEDASGSTTKTIASSSDQVPSSSPASLSTSPLALKFHSSGTSSVTGKGKRRRMSRSKRTRKSSLSVSQSVNLAVTDSDVEDLNNPKLWKRAAKKSASPPTCAPSSSSEPKLPVTSVSISSYLLSSSAAASTAGTLPSSNVSYQQESGVLVSSSEETPPVRSNDEGVVAFSATLPAPPIKVEFLTETATSSESESPSSNPLVSFRDPMLSESENASLAMKKGGNLEMTQTMGQSSNKETDIETGEACSIVPELDDSPFTDQLVPADLMGAFPSLTQSVEAVDTINSGSDPDLAAVKQSTSSFVEEEGEEEEEEVVRLIDVPSESESAGSLPKLCISIRDETDSSDGDITLTEECTRQETEVDINSVGVISNLEDGGSCRGEQSTTQETESSGMESSTTEQSMKQDSGSSGIESSPATNNIFITMLKISKIESLSESSETYSPVSKIIESTQFLPPRPPRSANLHGGTTSSPCDQAPIVIGSDSSVAASSTSSSGRGTCEASVASDSLGRDIDPVEVEEAPCDTARSPDAVKIERSEIAEEKSETEKISQENNSDTLSSALSPPPALAKSLSPFSNNSSLKQLSSDQLPPKQLPSQQQLLAQQDLSSPVISQSPILSCPTPLQITPSSLSSILQSSVVKSLVLTPVSSAAPEAASSSQPSTSASVEQNDTSVTSEKPGGSTSSPPPPPPPPPPPLPPTLDSSADLSDSLHQHKTPRQFTTKSSTPTLKQTSTIIPSTVQPTPVSTAPKPPCNDATKSETKSETKTETKSATKTEAKSLTDPKSKRTKGGGGSKRTSATIESLLEKIKRTRKTLEKRARSSLKEPTRAVARKVVTVQNLGPTYPGSYSGSGNPPKATSSAGNLPPSQISNKKDITCITDTPATQTASSTGASVKPEHLKTEYKEKTISSKSSEIHSSPVVLPRQLAGGLKTAMTTEDRVPSGRGASSEQDMDDIVKELGFNNTTYSKLIQSLQKPVQPVLKPVIDTSSFASHYLPVFDNEGQQREQHTVADSVADSLAANLSTPGTSEEVTPHGAPSANEEGGEGVCGLKKFKPYTSPLLSLSSYRVNASYRTHEKLSLSSLSHSNKIDPNKIWCSFEALGKCENPECPRQHIRDITPSQSEIVGDIIGYSPDISSNGPPKPQDQGERMESESTATSPRSYGTWMIETYSGKMSEEQVLILAAHQVTKATMVKEDKASVFDLEVQRAEEVEDGKKAEFANSRLPPLHWDGGSTNPFLFPSPSSSITSATRYFDTASSSETTPTNPTDPTHFLSLSRDSTDQSESLKHLEAGLSLHPSSEKLWLRYLELKSEETSSSPYKAREELIDNALTSCPTYPVINKCVQVAMTVAEKSSILYKCCKVISSQESSSEEGRHHAQSLHIFELLLSHAYLFCLAGRVKYSLDLLKHALIDDGPSPGIAQYLNLHHLQLAFLCLIHLTYTSSFPHHLFLSSSSSSSSLPLRLNQHSKFFIIPWAKSYHPSDEDLENIESLLKKGQDLVKIHNTANNNMSSATSEDMTFHFECNLVIFHLVHKSIHTAQQTLTSLLQSSPHSPRMWILFAQFGDRASSLKTAVNILSNGRRVPMHGPAAELYCYAIKLHIKQGADGCHGDTLQEALPWLQACICNYYNVSKESAKKMSLTDIAYHLRKILHLMIPYSYVVAKRIRKEEEKESLPYIWIIYCLLVQLSHHLLQGDHHPTAPDDAFESAVHSINRTAHLRIVWLEYLSYLRHDVLMRKGSLTAFKAFSDCVYRCLVVMDTIQATPTSEYGQSNPSYHDYTFQEQVCDMFFSTLPPSSICSVKYLEQLVHRLPHSRHLISRYATVCLEQWPSCLHKAQAVLAGFLSHHLHSPLIWRLAIQVELALNNKRETRWLFHEAVKNCPLSADLWKEFLHFELCELHKLNTSLSPPPPPAPSPRSLSLVQEVVTKASSLGILLPHFPIPPLSFSS